MGRRDGTTQSRRRHDQLTYTLVDLAVAIRIPLGEDVLHLLETAVEDLDQLLVRILREHGAITRAARCGGSASRHVVACAEVRQRQNRLKRTTRARETCDGADARLSTAATGSRFCDTTTGVVTPKTYLKHIRTESQMCVRGATSVKGGGDTSACACSGVCRSERDGKQAPVCTAAGADPCRTRARHRARRVPGASSPPSTHPRPRGKGPMPAPVRKTGVLTKQGACALPSRPQNLRAAACRGACALRVRRSH